MPSRCPHCEVEIEEGARFCGACGRPITATAISQRAAAALPKHSPAAATIKVSPQEPAAPSPAASGASPGASPAFGIPFQAPAAAATIVSSTPSIAPVTSAPVASAPAASTAAAAAPVRAAVGVRPAAQPLENLIGRTLNHRYLVGDKVGEGGFGAVFRGKQLATGREVALKILHPHNVSDETIVARFRREAEACSKLRDPHTVTTYDFDETPDGILYLAMELLRGQSLHQVQKAEGPLGYERVLKILDQVAASLSEAHLNGIVHRDMKPENVFIESRDGQDHVKVLDFGIAKVVSDERQVPALTAVGQTLGTLEFMSPEQLRGQKLDGRSDLYALGMMSYEMLTGILPFASAKSPIDIINFHMRSEPPPPSKLSDKVTIPALVDAIILKMVAKDKDKRFADANALREEIARTRRSLDSSPDRFEAYRVVAVVGATIAIVAALLFFLHR
jgi:hypothetical protein